MLRRKFNRFHKKELKSAPPTDYSEVLLALREFEYQNKGRKPTPRYLEMV